MEDLVALKKRLDSKANTNPKDDSFLKMWQSLAGDQAAGMLIGPEETKKGLEHSSWRVRLAAISILREKWKMYRELAPIIEKMAFEDEEPQVRATALFSLACCVEGTNDVRIGNLFVGIVKNETLAKEFREAAYGGLFRLRGPTAGQPPLPGRYRFPEDIDWHFVESFVG